MGPAMRTPEIKANGGPEVLHGSTDPDSAPPPHRVALAAGPEGAAPVAQLAASRTLTTLTLYLRGNQLGAVGARRLADLGGAPALRREGLGLRQAVWGLLPRWFRGVRRSFAPVGGVALPFAQKFFLVGVSFF